MNTFLLQSLLKTADQLKIKGLCEVPEGREGNSGCGAAEVTPLPILSRRSFTKLRRLSGSKRQRGPDMVRRAIFKECDHNHHLQQQQLQQQPLTSVGTPTGTSVLDLGVAELSARSAESHVPECVTVATSTEDDNPEVPVVVLESKVPQHQVST